MRDETAKDNCQTAAWSSHDLTRNNKLVVSSSTNRHVYRGAGMAQRWERLPPTNVVRVRFPDPASYVGWVLLLVLLLAPTVFLWVLRYSSLHENTPNSDSTQDRGPTWKPAKADVTSSLNIVIYQMLNVFFFLFQLMYQQIVDMNDILRNSNVELDSVSESKTNEPIISDAERRLFHLQFKKLH